MKWIGTLALGVAASALLAGACANKEDSATRKASEDSRAARTAADPGGAAGAGAEQGGAAEAAEAPGAGQHEPGDAAAAPAAASAGQDAGAPQAATLAGLDFIEDARVLFRVVACVGETPVPEHLNARIVAAHCKRLRQRKDRYRQRYATMAKEFIAKLRPEGLPGKVVYPFGGGDLISALVAYPDALEITTMSLEHAGDPRRIRDLGRDDLEASLSAFGEEIGGMLVVSNNTSKNLSEAHTNLLPVQLSSFLVGLAVHDFEPVSVRYIALEDDGRVRYLDAGDIKAMEDVQARQLKHDWQQPNFSKAFSNVEIRFRRRGAAPGEPVRVHRHFAVNLSDEHLDQNPAILAHLRAKGRIVAMTKAASYLLWRGNFSHIRSYLLEQMDYMISDSTGIPPRHARRAGMVQTPLGRYNGSFLDAPEEHNEDFLELWSNAPRRRLPFRFGYVDADKQAHLLITRPSGK